MPLCLFIQQNFENQLHSRHCSKRCEYSSEQNKQNSWPLWSFKNYLRRQCWSRASSGLGRKTGWWGAWAAGVQAASCASLRLSQEATDLCAQALGACPSQGQESLGWTVEGSGAEQDDMEKANDPVQRRQRLWPTGIPPESWSFLLLGPLRRVKLHCKISPLAIIHDIQLNQTNWGLWGNLNRHQVFPRVLVQDLPPFISAGRWAKMVLYWWAS